MIKKLLFFLVTLGILNCALADTRTAMSNRDIQSTDVDNPLREYAQKAIGNNDSALQKQTDVANTDSMPTKNLKQENIPTATDNGDSLSSLVDTSDESYEKLLAHAEEILGDRDSSETRERINRLTQQLDNKIQQEKQAKQKESMKKTVQKADKIIKDQQNIEAEFKDDPHDYYQGKSVINHIDENVKKSNDAYEIENFDNLLDDIKSPEKIEKTFDEIDNDEGKYQYKLKDGYPIEQITTVGLLSGQDKRFKKCLILKTYGGGTWRTYCQPLKQPTQCPDYDWNQLDSMAIMYC